MQILKDKKKKMEELDTVGPARAVKYPAPVILRSVPVQKYPFSRLKRKLSFNGSGWAIVHS